MGDPKENGDDENAHNKPEERKSVKFEEGRPRGNSQDASDDEYYRGLRHRTHYANCSCSHNLECRFYHTDRYSVTRATDR